MIRTRFAPSPTGYLHIGGVRTALFNFLYARSQKGQFLLRIEDTDAGRSRAEYEEDILHSLKWLGLAWDEEPIRQSERLDQYRAVARELVDKGLAYEEKIGEKTAVKFKMPERKAKFTDLVRGDVEFDTSLFDDLVIIKSDGFPTYHLACVVDDHEQEISHIIRGDDHLSNTPRQIQLYEALGWKPPKYAHVPLILGQDGAPLSKRHTHVSLKAYEKEGYLAEGLLNYLALLGWGGEGNQEFYNLQALIKAFTLKKITKSGAKFDTEKLEWMNAQHIKKKDKKEYLDEITRFLKELAETFSPEVWKELVYLYQSRITTYKDLREQASYCFEEPRGYAADTKNKMLDQSHREYLSRWLEAAEKLESFKIHSEIETMTRQSLKKIRRKQKN